MVDVVQELAKVDSVELLFFLAFIAFMFFVILPAYNSHIEAKRVVMLNNAEREKNMLEVISRNSETISKNTDAITAVKEAVFGSDIQRRQTLDRMHGRLDSINSTIETIAQDVLLIKERK